MARNSAAFYETAVGASRLGVDVVYLNTGFAAEQVADVVTRQELRALAHDPEFADRVPDGVLRIPLTGDPAAAASVAALAAASHRLLDRLDQPSRHVILTFGTTGRPKGVPRTGGGLDSVLALMSGLPLRVRQTHLVAAPLFHAWGWLNLLLTMLLRARSW